MIFFFLQEIHSLRNVVEMRSAENRDLRIHNNELLTQVERLTYLESELRNAQHRLDEMTLVLQNKMDSERELLELSETLQEELVKSRAETLQYRKGNKFHEFFFRLIFTRVIYDRVLNEKNNFEIAAFFFV